MTQAGDPNFPVGLSIRPSSKTVATSWERDTEQDIEKYGIAGRIWEAAYLLARYMRLQPVLEFDPPCSVFATINRIVAVELGSGAGYGGLNLGQQLALHSKDAKDTLVITDLANVVPLMQRNVIQAGLGSTQDAVDVRVRQLSWGSDEDAAALMTELDSPLTHIVCSDLVYFPELLPLLLRSLICLSEPQVSGSSGPELIISYKIRSLNKEQPFWSALGFWFDYTAVDSRPMGLGTDQQAEWHRFGSIPSDYGGPEDDDQEYFIFVGRRRPDSIGCIAPASDACLMQGQRLRQHETNGEHLESAAGGSDYFEWLLLSGMGPGTV